MSGVALTLDLARQLERKIAPRERGVFGDAEFAQFGEAVARKVNGAWPTSAVFCMSHADLGRLGEILAFFERDGIRPAFYLTPMGFSRELAAALHARGYCPCDHRQAILFGEPLTAPPTNPPGITIEPVTEANADAFVAVTSAGFGWAEPWRRDAEAGLRKRVEESGFCGCLARVNGEPSAAGQGGAVGDDHVAFLGEAATIPRFRNRGCHLALLRHRMHLAHTLGAELVMGAADFGSPSFRNQHRAGLRMAYMETTWRR